MSIFLNAPHSCIGLLILFVCCCCCLFVSLGEGGRFLVVFFVFVCVA